MSEVPEVGSDSGVGLVVLAAGESRRLGRPKQLLPFRGGSLLRYILQTATDSGCEPIMVVLGAYIDQIRPETEGLPVQVVENLNWNAGMSGSIRVGLEALTASHQEVEAMICMVCDQPGVTAEHLARIVDLFRKTGASLIASEYGGALGVPALFASELFPQLMALQGASGAKSVIEANRTRALAIPFPEGVLDIDTSADIEREEIEGKR